METPPIRIEGFLCLIWIRLNPTQLNSTQSNPLTLSVDLAIEVSSTHCMHVSLVHLVVFFICFKMLFAQLYY